MTKVQGITLNSNTTLFEPTIAAIRNDLLDVGLILERTASFNPAEQAPQLDQKLKGIQAAADATRRLAVLLRPSRPKAFDPVKSLRALSGQIDLEPAAVSAEEATAETPQIFGDPEQIHEVVYLLTKNIKLQAGARFQGALTFSEGAQLVIRVTPQGSLPSHFTVDGYYTLDWEQLGAIWSAATQGGYFERTENILVGHLTGNQEMAPAPADSVDEGIVEVMQQLTRLLRPWRNAIGMYEPGFMDISEMAAMYRETVHNAYQLLDKLPR